LNLTDIDSAQVLNCVILLGKDMQISGLKCKTDLRSCLVGSEQFWRLAESMFSHVSLFVSVEYPDKDFYPCSLPVGSSSQELSLMLFMEKSIMHSRYLKMGLNWATINGFKYSGQFYVRTKIKI